MAFDFSVIYSYVVGGAVNVQAETVEEAIAAVEAMQEVPEDGDFIPGSFVVDHFATKDLNG